MQKSKNEKAEVGTDLGVKVVSGKVWEENLKVSPGERLTGLSKQWAGRGRRFGK